MAGDRTAIVAGGEGRNTPAAAHVASLALAGRASVASSLHRAARLATGSEHADGLAYPWHRRPPPTLAALRAGLADRYAVATANASVNAIRGALRAAWLSGDMDRAMLERSLAALRAGAGEGRSGPGALPGGSPQAVRGRRRREGRRVARARAWIAVRGTEDGPLFRPVNKGGRVIAGGMSPRAIGKRVQVLGTRAGLGKVSPHMLRRSFATSLLSAGNDLSVTADLMGHARTDTTRLYDRRGESAKRAAASTISVPYVRPGA